MAQKKSRPSSIPLAGKRAKYRQEAIDKFLAKFPNMTYAEIRRHRIDFSKAICLELKEDGHTDASSEIRRLIHEEELQSQAAEQSSTILARPLLKDQHSMLEALQRGLRQAEKEKVSGRPDRVGTTYLHLAIYFQEKGANWYHIAEEFFKKSCKIGEKYIIDGGRMAAIANYSYGKFLMEKMKNESKAICLLETAQNTSIGRLWLLPSIEPIDFAKEKEAAQDNIWSRELEVKVGEVGTIYEETCALLNKIYLKMAKSLRDGPNSNLEDAVELCSKLLKNAEKSGRTNLIFEALEELGLCHLEKEDFHSAQNYFEKLLRFSSQNGLKTAVCQAHQQLGYVYERSKDPIKALYHFESFCKTTNSIETIHLRGKSYRCLGAFHLSEGNNDEATECLERALNECKLYKLKKETGLQEELQETDKAPLSDNLSKTNLHEPLEGAMKNIIDVEMEKELERINIFAAIAKGLKHLPLYARLVMSSSEDRECMKVLMQWRDSGKPFWNTSLIQQLSKISSKPELEIAVPSTYPPSVISSDFPSDFQSDTESDDYLTK